MKKLSDIKKYKDSYFLIKFLEEKYLKDLLEGKFYMKNLGFFIDLEKKKKNKGQGDKYEGALVRKQQDTQLVINGKHVINAQQFTEVRRYRDVKKMPVFCCTIFRASDFEVVNETDLAVYVKIILNEQQKNKLLDDFGKKAVRLPKGLMDRVDVELSNLGLSGEYGPVKYIDNNIGYIEREKAFKESQPDMLFWKDKYFEYQKEYRFVITGKFIEDHCILNIGDISQRVTVMDTTEFFEALIELPK
ncbi:hypothetical protein [Bacillus thuringiensis]|uniref:Uncharacterized protein n=1 Tax=Bacillus thuringiensis TaxID=1428 RepID=A0A9X6TID5_BACTU|nr:hypothetical protein [Bacillus thuringiensis]ANT39934.1 hypothetical protein BMBtpLA1_4 [Bacillus phage vB_BtS_BMBtp13]MEC2708470.1 hypothetical protein [Bacillus thuringiensis]OUB68458.1 hypothetical protein BK765_19575 [Bacillus thuringiensis serovar dakota]PEA86709.1 hypothetical protein CON71_28615 [Bacillus thuringiensis]